MATRSGLVPVLSSDWGELSSHLIASFYPVKKLVSDDRRRVIWVRDMDQPEVQAPITDGAVDTTINWQSPFENMWPQQNFRSFDALLQSGGFNAIFQALQAQFPQSGLVGSIAKKVASFEGRSGFTKLNSTQVFTGMPPLKIDVTAHFRAYKDPVNEVRAPMNQLMQWALPQRLADDVLASSVKNGDLDMLPSQVPQIIGMKYADMLFSPLVIERIPYQLTGPRDANGVLTHAAVVLSLASLTALDRQDWIDAGGRRSYRPSQGY